MSAAAERTEFDADMAEIEVLGEAAFAAIVFMVDVGMTPTILPLPGLGFETAVLVSQYGFLDDPAGAALREWRESRSAA